MGIKDTIRGWLGVDHEVYDPQRHGAGEGRSASEQIAHYNRLLDYYQSRSPLDALGGAGPLNLETSTTDPQAARALAARLRNPCNRVGEFYAGKLWGGPFEDAFALKRAATEVEKAVRLVLEASNWGQAKQPAARRFAIMGDLFLRSQLTADRKRAYIEAIDPRDVTDLRHNKRGHLEYVRLDIPTSRTNASGKREPFTVTEVWDKPGGVARIWEHNKGGGALGHARLDALGTPTTTLYLSTSKTQRNALGIDFIPFQHARFRDIGRRRGVSAFEHAIPKIDHADVVAAKMYKMLFPKWPWFAEQSAFGPDGEVLAPATWSQPSGPLTVGPMDIGGETFLKGPSGVSLKPLVPPIDFASHLNALIDQIKEIEKDLPELRYYRIMEETTGNSSRAIRNQLADLVDKADEARAAGMSAVQKAVQTCITLGKNAGIKEFASLPDFEHEDRRIEFSGFDPFPPSVIEALEADDRRLALYQRAVLVGMTPEEARAYAKLPEGAIKGGALQPAAPDLAAAAQQMGAGFNAQAPTNSPSPAPAAPQPGVPLTPPSGGTP